MNTAEIKKTILLVPLVTAPPSDASFAHPPNYLSPVCFLSPTFALSPPDNHCKAKHIPDTTKESIWLCPLLGVSTQSTAHFFKDRVLCFVVAWRIGRKSQRLYARMTLTQASRTHHDDSFPTTQLLLLGTFARPYHKLYSSKYLQHWLDARNLLR
jgi:hypothetical protein